jgi:hypothetical protein
LTAQFGDVRKTTVALFRNLDEEAWDRGGLANQNEVSVRARAYIIAGHELHHRLAAEIFYGRFKTLYIF